MVIVRPVKSALQSLPYPRWMARQASPDGAIRVGHQHKRQDDLVPLAEEVEDADRDQPRLSERQHDLETDPVGTRLVDDRRRHLARERAEEAVQEEDGEGERVGGVDQDQAVANFRVQELPARPTTLLPEVFRSSLVWEAGCRVPPTVSGLGVVADWAAARRYPFTPQSSPGDRLPDGTFVNP